MAWKPFGKPRSHKKSIIPNSKEEVLKEMKERNANLENNLHNMRDNDE